MPSLAVSKKYILELIGHPLEDSKFEQMVFDFGVELDDIYEEDGVAMYKFDVPANRYDLLCAEGLATAMKSYIFSDQFQDIAVLIPSIEVHKEETHERPFIACAVIKNIQFSDESFKSFISYQDKLHLSIGRNRSLVAIGTHDLDSMNGKITYSSVNLEEVSFVPLNGSSEIKGSDLQQYFEKDKKISKYFGLLTDSNRAVAFKSNQKIMSIPPIINSEATKITKETKNIFIEVTGTDFNKVNTALKLILYNFRGESIESVLIKSKGGDLITPVFKNRSYSFTAEHICKKLNLDLSSEDIKKLLEKMMYSVTIDKQVNINVPDIRQDVMQECDILEDLAIAYGFNNFIKKMPEIYTVGREDPFNKFTDKIRQEMALCGFNEVLTLTLLSSHENIVRSEEQVVLLNPKSKEAEVARTSLLPGLLKSVSSNLHARIPIKIFEAADVVLLDNRSSSIKSDEGAYNCRMLCGLLASNTPQLEDLQGPLSAVFNKCGFTDYKYEHTSDSRYLENQCASVILNGKCIGTIGVLHPSVCCMFKIPYAASSFEINLEEVYNEFSR